MNIVYTVEKDGKEQTQFGTHKTHQGAEDVIFRHVTNEIKGTGTPFHEAVKRYGVGKKEV